MALQVLGMCLILILVTGFAFDLWRGFSARRSATAAADSAAAAGATALDEAAYRADGTVRLVPATAEARACEVLRHSDAAAACDADHITVDATGASPSVTVTVERPFQFTLLRPFLQGTDATTVRVSSTASPR